MNNENLFEAIYTLYNTSNDFNTATNGQFEYSVARDTWTNNFAVIQGTDIAAEDLFSQDIEDVTFQINVFSTVRATCWSLLQKCRDLFDGQYLTVTGATSTIRISRETQLPPIWNEPDKLYQATIIFGCILY